MSKKHPNSLEEVKQGWLYRSWDGYLVWLTHEHDRSYAHKDCPLWHATESGTWMVRDYDGFYPMTRLMRLDED